MVVRRGNLCLGFCFGCHSWAICSLRDLCLCKTLFLFAVKATSDLSCRSVHHVVGLDLVPNLCRCGRRYESLQQDHGEVFWRYLSKGLKSVSGMSCQRSVTSLQFYHEGVIVFLGVSCIVGVSMLNASGDRRRTGHLYRSGVGKELLLYFP